MSHLELIYLSSPLNSLCLAYIHTGMEALHQALSFLSVLGPRRLTFLKLLLRLPPAGHGENVLEDLLDHRHQTAIMKEAYSKKWIL